MPPSFPNHKGPYRPFAKLNVFLGIVSIAYVIPWMILSSFIWRLLPPENFRGGVLAIETVLMLFGLIVLHRLIKSREHVLAKHPSESKEVTPAAHELCDTQIIDKTAETILTAPVEVIKKNDGELEAIKKAQQDALDEVVKLSKTLEEKGRELVSVDEKLKEWMLKCQQVEEDRNQIKKNLDDQIKLKESIILQYQETIAVQRGLLTKQSQEAEDGKAVEHAGEGGGAETVAENHQSVIKISEIPEERDEKKAVLELPQRNVEMIFENNLQEQLKKCIDCAVKLGNEGGLGGHGAKLSDFAFDTFTVDLRRLFDRFRWESPSIIFVYSRYEEKLLFINEEVKNLLGWGPEKVIMNFPSLLPQGFEYWRNLAASISHSEIRQVEILLRTRDGKKIPVPTLMGIIPSGAYQNHLVGLFDS